ncbi:MAG: exonuclease subunit SbcC [Symploca sp. SIO3C6]|uniref:Nuclease SbcCD subunit C n=1 Tax=Symploca sp. SIO1C4 TaxID=2607765 RepID=A0A6B3NEC6_9CYAN|nr:exonuclease subunit SbcC [Symploca sp. SIO3C6]NER28001.1 exonuclease subunit SbcC [Symploca sp. SIO1C4]
MIPLQLTLKNFLSYREATLNFRGLHTACVCGPNGAGKSSLLEAITWVLWGKSRAASEDDVINTGAKDVRVDFIFENNSAIHRVIRVRNRGQGCSLEFQVQTPNGFVSLTEKGVKATQQLILHHLRLDYDTFINSAYLRQGRADEFMLRRPNERKQILADLLKLDQYEELALQAKDFSKQFKGQAQQQSQSLQIIAKQLEERGTITQNQATLENTLKQLQQEQEADTLQLQKLQALEHQRRCQQQQLTFVRQQHQNLSTDCDRLQQEVTATEAHKQQLCGLLSQEEQINIGYSQYIQLQEQEEVFASKFQVYQQNQQQLQQLQQQLTQQVNEIRLQIRQKQAELEALQPQEQEIQETLARSGEVATALEKLKQLRRRLSELDSLQLHVSPLLQRRNSITRELDLAQTRLATRLEELRSSESQLSAQVATTPQLRRQCLSVDAEIGELEKRRVYQQRVQEKGLERRSFQERLQENQRRYQQQLGELTQKIKMLQAQDAICPLCEQPLDEAHGNHVIEKTTQEHKQVQDQFWVVREQLATCERELQVLREEYAQLSRTLAPYEELREQRGQLEARLEATDDVYDRLYEVSEEKKQIEQALDNDVYAVDLREELQQLEGQLQQLDYDEQTHALVRSEVDRWRWAEIRSAKIEEAQRRQRKIDASKPKIQGQLDALQASLQSLQNNSQLKRKIEALEQKLQDIDYNLTEHNQLRATVRQAQSWQLRYQEFQSAQQQYPKICQSIESLTQTLAGRHSELKAISLQLDGILKQLEQEPDPTQEIQVLETRIQHRRRQLDQQLSQQGSLQQRLTQLAALQEQYTQQQQELQHFQRQFIVYQELAQAFGKNGIQALMIENVLPQLEAEANQILTRLTGNQLHVQIVTQRAGRRASKKTTKLIDTLDILIADASGTRPYETYSGGEAFRINFSIRLALAKLLAQRAGTSLQMLIVDEGFGTQDSAGCERLIAAINAIASEFSCILTVTHMPQFKEAFQTRIEVSKTQNGSQLSLSI